MPYGTLSGYTEAQPAYSTVAANSITSLRARVGLRYRFAVLPGLGGAVPVVDAAADYRMFRSTALGTDVVFYPRLSFGITRSGAGGSFSLTADIGKTRSDTFDRGLSAQFDLKF